MESKIVQKSEAYVRQLLEEKLSEDYLFHNVAHTQSVRYYSKLFGEQEGVSPKELEILDIAACFHDTGYTELYTGHEAVSRRLAEDFLTKENYPAEKIKIIGACIDATHTDYVPTTELQKIIKDADLSNLGLKSFYDLGVKLRHEWAVLCGQQYSDIDWLENNLNFLSVHQFYTDAANELLRKGKKKNLKKMKALVKMAKEKSSKDKAPIEGSKSTQMMFKTSLRNHIDLTGIADNKANMMLSINALIITIAMPLLAAYIENNIYMLLPSGCLLLTCILSVIFATLATRPIKMMGTINMDSLRKGNSNIFFFGNFYQMTLEEYRAAADIVVKDDTILEKSIVNDLYYLGRALGNKYSQLRTCYLIFMVGMTTTVIAFVVSFMRAKFM